MATTFGIPSIRCTRWLEKDTVRSVGEHPEQGGHHEGEQARQRVECARPPDYGADKLLFLVPEADVGQECPHEEVI